MSRITINDLNIANTSFGLLLGAGASFEAGFPLMTELTKSVLRHLSGPQVQQVYDILAEDFDGEVNVQEGIPNIEIVADLISVRAIQLGEVNGRKYLSLMSDIRDAIVDIIMSISNPRLDYHIQMFEAFKRIREYVAAPLWIFTTNYDSLIELAAAEVGIPLNDGFLGGGPVRFLDVKSLSTVSGTINGRANFEPRKGLQINLVKLHGSIDWWTTKRDTHTPKVFSTTDESRLRYSSIRTIIFPQRSKVYETMGYPYDQLWRVANTTLGRECKYLTTIGYSFGDEHINQNLLIPYLFNKRMKVSALSGIYPTSFKELEQYSAFNFVTATQTKIGGQILLESSELWKFSAFVRELCGYAGV